MKKILVIGCCGAGKSVLSRHLGAETGLPVYHLDQIWWLPGWVTKSREEFDRELSVILQRDEWIIDGNYQRTLPERLKYADTVIFLDYPRWLCIGRVLKRMIRFHGRLYSDSAPDCPEHFDLKFLLHVWNFQKTIRPGVESALQIFSGTVHHFRTPQETDVFLKHLSAKSG